MNRLAFTAAACALVAAACAGSADEGGDDPVAIDVFGPFREVEADDFAASLAEFERLTGVPVRYTGTANFEQEIRARIDSGIDRPDIAMVPQPGLIVDFARAGALVPLSARTVEEVEANFGSGFDTLIDDGTSYFVPYRASIKSLVWYRPAVFEQHGWTVPTTLDELDRLVDEMSEHEADESLSPDFAPWCFNVNVGTVPGWPATDWLEDLLLRGAGADAYDEWVRGERKFDDATVRSALETFDSSVLAPGRSFGGRQRILGANDPTGPLVADRPGCALFKQASFAELWFPDDFVVGSDVDFFVLPGTSATEPAPLVVGGSSAVQFTERPEVAELMTFLASPEGGQVWAERGGYFSLRTSIDVDEYHTGIDARFAELLQDEDRVVRFDGSDMMPASIGSSLLWAEITAWIAKSSTLDAFVATMDDAYAAVLDDSGR